MLDAEAATRWNSDPGLLDALRRWRWFREAVPPVLADSAAAVSVEGPVDVDFAALAQAFWSWAAALDRDDGFEHLDRLDFAHFLSGQLLHAFVLHPPLIAPQATRSQTLLALVRTALTVLAAWRMALGAGVPRVDIPGEHSEHWSSFLENTAEDASAAVGFLDLFTGLEPVWQAPLLVVERPAVRQALARRVQAAASAPPG